MQRLFIADLHLSPEHPRLVRGFLDVLKAYQGKIDELYILGDWFEAWLGDDDDNEWLNGIVQALKVFAQVGTQVYFIRGNRDFALGQKFLDRFGGKLLPDEITIEQNSLRIRIEHGDALCTDDVDYQKFKKIIRNPILLKILLLLPLKTRRAIANYARQKSKQSHQKHNQLKTRYIMDVNEQAVQEVLATHDLIIHGHTHRPQIHEYADGKKRYVLGDWRDPSTHNKAEHGEAVIALLNDEGVKLVDWRF